MCQAQKKTVEREERRRRIFPENIFSGRRMNSSATVIRKDGELLKDDGNFKSRPLLPAFLIHRKLVPCGSKKPFRRDLFYP